MAQGNGAARRWALVLGLVAVLVALPALIAAWPAADAHRSAVDLRTAALASTGVAFSGYAESVGGLALPGSDHLSTVADLFSARTAMRVWWRAPDDNRVDVLSAGGETDVHRDPSGAWTWDYESDRVRRTEPSPLALPAPADLLPTTLARRLLSEADPSELSRLGADRVAGHDALGLRLVPSDAASSVASVDVWVDAVTGLPLRVRLFGKGATNPAINTSFLDLQVGEQSPSVTSFTPPVGATVEPGPDYGVLEDAGRRLSQIPLPSTLAGLQRRTLEGAPRAIGLYGRGVTLLVVLPLPSGLAGELHRAAEQNPTAVRDELGTRLTAGPIGILLVETLGRTSYGLIGTVTLDALAQAARELPELNGRP